MSSMIAQVAIAALTLSGGVSASETMTYGQFETSLLTQSAQRAEFGVEGPDSAFKFRFSDSEVSDMTDNAAVLQQRSTKASNPFLSTLSAPGEAQFLTVLKPCGILMPHLHLRANEFYTVLYGTMDAGIAQENGVAQDITFEVGPGEVFIVPQATIHHNYNNQCIPNLFLQSFTSADPGAINVVGALAALRDGSDSGFRAISASGAADVEASPLGGFALDQECLQRCGFPSIGAPGDGLMDLPAPFRALFGSALSGNPGFSPPGSPQNPETPPMTRRARTPRPATNATSTGNL